LLVLMKMGIVSKVLMFDINFLKNPGILENKKNISSIKAIEDKDDSSLIDLSINKELNKTKIKNTKNYLLILVSIGLLLLILGSVLNHNKINEENSLKSIDVPIDSLLNVLQKNSSYANIDYLYFTNQKISFRIDVLNESIFYDFLHTLDNDLNKGIKAIHKENKFFITGNFPWAIKDNNDFTINLLDKEISDFTLDLRKEIYKDKLIIICGIQSVFELLNLIMNLNLIDKFQIRVEEIQTLPEKMNLFKIIIN